MPLFCWDFSLGYASLWTSPVASTCNKGGNRWSVVVARSDIETLMFHGPFLCSSSHLVWICSEITTGFLLVLSMLNMYRCNVMLDIYKFWET